MVVLHSQCQPGSGQVRPWAAPAGTCYLAASPAAAIIERTADSDADQPPVLSSRALAALRVWSGAVDSARNLADTTQASVATLTSEIATVVPYDLAWLG